MTTTTHGQIGYEAYAASTGGKTFDGRDMPLWPNLPANITKAWGAAAAAILECAPRQLPRTAE